MGGIDRTKVNLMHATFRQSAPSGAARGIRGTFYPADGSGGSGAAGSALAKVAFIVVGLAVVRGIVAHASRRHGVSGVSRRRQMIAELHRELHAEDAAATEPSAKA
jgi:hypothetical protein